LNETSGTIAYDASGFGRNGTYNGNYVQGTPGIVPSEPWTSIETLGIAMPGSAPVTMGKQLGLGFNGIVWAADFSIAAWIKPAVLPQAAPAFEWNGYGLGLVSQAYNYAGDYPTLNIPCVANVRSAAPTFSDGQAHFLVGTMHWLAGTQVAVALYVDGAPAAASTQPYCDESSFAINTSVGADSGTDGGAYPFKGFVSGPAVFPTVLTAAQVRAIYLGNLTP
jgi:hypothetical protein